MDFKPHASSKKEIDFYRQELTRKDYIDTLIKLSSDYHGFYYKGKLIAIAGVIQNSTHADYWQFLSEDFPDYIPLKFLKEYIAWGDSILTTNDLTCNVLKENRFAYWLIHHGKKKSGWDVVRTDNAWGSKFFIKSGGGNKCVVQA